jgi:hypothetical protein
MNKLLLILFLFFLNSMAFATGSITSRKIKCLHFHFSNATENVNFDKGFPTAGKEIIADVSDDDTGSKNTFRDTGSVCIALFRTYRYTLKSVHFSPTVPLTNKSELNSVLRI